MLPTYWEDFRWWSLFLYSFLFRFGGILFKSLERLFFYIASIYATSDLSIYRIWNGIKQIRRYHFIWSCVRRFSECLIWLFWDIPVYPTFIGSGKINQDENAGTQLTVMLALSAITNFLSGIPSMGRFCSMVVTFLMILWASNHHILKRYDKYFMTVPLLYAYSLLYWVRHIAEITELYLFIFPVPLTTIYYLFII